MPMRTFAQEAALQSALISGFDPLRNQDEQFNVHYRVLRDILECVTGALTHPIIINMALSSAPHRVQYRPGKRAAEAEYLPESKYLRALLMYWWFRMQWEIQHVRRLSEEEQRTWVWDQHDFLICLEPFKSANGRTARIVYYMLLTALGLSPNLISAEKAKVYYAHKRKYREEVFAPLMRAHGYIK